MAALATALALACLAAAALLLAGLAAARTRGRALRRMEGLLDNGVQPDTDADAARAVLPDFLARRLLRAGWEPDRRQALMATGAWPAAAVIGVALGGLSGGLCAAIALPLLGWAALEYRAGVNMAQLAGSMLGLLERIRQLLSVGNSFQTALQRAVENSPPVVGRALAPALRRIDNGAGVADSIERAARELDIYELHLLATAARTNLRFGGAMTAILKNIIENIRRRTAVERELRADTTQTRASAWVLGLLPLLVAGIVMVTNRDYSRWFLATESGHRMILYAAVSQVLGILAMRLITRTRY